MSKTLSLKPKMEPKFIIFSTLIFSFISNSPVLTQISTPCSPTTLSTVTPCLNFLTNSSGNGTSPTADCCDALRSLTGTGMDCLCLILTASVPFRIPINRTLAISLPRACGMPGVPVQCRASAAPLPAPGPAALGPTISPKASPAPEAPVVPGPAEAPESDTTPLLTPPSPAADNGGSRTAVTPSAASPSSHPQKLSLLLFALGFGILKCF